MQARNILTKSSPTTARSEKPGLTYYSAPRQKFHCKRSIVRAQRHENIFEIKSKCATVNWNKGTKFHL